MATTLPGSPYVESSDLVANYPAVSEALAERVDLVGVLPFADAAARTTALPTPTDGQYSYLQDTNSTEFYNGAAWVVAGVAPGLVHVNTTSYTAVSSISLNDVFTSDYDNYVIHLTQSTTGTDIIRYRLRASGTDLTSSVYVYGMAFVGTASPLGYQAGSTSQTSGVIGVSFASSQGSLILQLFNPQKTIHKNSISNNSALSTTGGTLYFGFCGIRSTVAHDGITIIADAGTMTGTIRVFGYKNS